MPAPVPARAAEVARRSRRSPRRSRRCSRRARPPSARQSSDSWTRRAGRRHGDGAAARRDAWRVRRERLPGAGRQRDAGAARVRLGRAAPRAQPVAARSARERQDHRRDERVAAPVHGRRARGRARGRDLRRAQTRRPGIRRRRVDPLSPPARRGFTTRMARVALGGGIPWTLELDGGITDLTGRWRASSSSDSTWKAERTTCGSPSRIPPARRGSASAAWASARRSSGPRACPSPSGWRAASRTCASTGTVARGLRVRRYVGPGYAESPDRYELEVLGGASEVIVNSPR